jgi:hypothetical protein
MIEADIGLTSMAMGNPTGGENPDDRLLVKFFIAPLENATRSKEEGRPIFEDMEWISIRTPGSRNEVCRPIRMEDKSRFPRHYQAFKSREEQELIEGTLLDEWPAIPRSLVEELKFFNVRTVEQLAGMADSADSNFKGIVMWKQKAQAYLDASKESAASDALKEAKERIDAQNETIAMLTKRLEALEAPKPKRKRRTKAEIEAANTE